MKVLTVILIACLACLSYFAWNEYEFSRWQSREFRALTPGEHYLRARWLLCPRSGIEPSANDLKAAIHHVEAIPVTNSTSDPTIQYVLQERGILLRMLHLKLERPQDFRKATEDSCEICSAMLAYDCH